MFSGSVQNRNLIIYSDANITAFSTSLIYIFENNVFQTYNTAVLSSNSKQLLITLNNSVKTNSSVISRIYTNGIVTTSTFSTTIIINNNTVFFDNQSPSLFEMIEQQNYNFTSYIYSNLVTGITSSATNPVANIVLKRNPPEGKITINEGYQGTMNVRRFAALSAPSLSLLGTSPTFFVPKNFAFNYFSYGDHTINSIGLGFTEFNNSGITTGALAYLSVNQDFGGSPSSVVLGVSSIIDLNGFTQKNFICDFVFNKPVLIPEGTYWFIFTPTADSSLPSGNITKLFSATNSYYSNNVITSQDGFSYVSGGYSGLGNLTITTETGYPLPTNDSIYNQLDQPQNIKVSYGDYSDLNSFTSLAVPVTSHYIKKTLQDPQQNIYAIEVLADGGSNAYEVKGLNAGGSYTQYFSMIANPYTTNIVRYDFAKPVQPFSLDSLYLNSLGDYYASSTQGKVLVSAKDFLGISKIEISTNPNFPTNSTTTITTSNTTTFLQNLSFDFGNVGTKYSTYLNSVAPNIKSLYTFAYSGSTAFIFITNDSVYFSQNNTVTLLYKITLSNFTCSVLGPQGIVISDTLGNIYNLSISNLQLIQVGIIPQGVPISMSLVSQSVFIGVGQINDTSNVVSDRRRIYLLNTFNYSLNNLSDISWSRQIPEPEITFIYNSSTLGLVVGSYDQVNLIGRVSIYNNNVLFNLNFANSATVTYMRPDYAYFSDNSQNLYIAYSNLSGASSAGSQIFYAKYTNNNIGLLNDTAISVAGTQVLQLAATNVTNKIIFVTNQTSYVFDETIFTTVPLALPSYTSSDTRGLLLNFQNNDLNISNYPSTVGVYTFNNLNYTFDISSTKSFSLEANGYIVFDNLDSTGQVGYSTSFFLNYPSDIASLLYFNYDGKAQTSNLITDTFYYQQPKNINFKLLVNIPSNSLGLGTFSLHNGISSSAPLVGITSLTPNKSLTNYLKTGGNTDYFNFSDGSLRTAKISDLISNLYQVYARFTDINNVVTASNQSAIDSIYNQKQQQNTNNIANSGVIYEINSNTNNPPNSFVPNSAQNNFIYSGSKIARASGIYESDPYYAADATSWGSLQVLCIIPGYNSISVGNSVEYGTSVTIFIKTSDSLNGLLNSQYNYSKTISTIDNQSLDYGLGTYISSSLSSFKGTWIQFKIVLTTASKNVNPIVKSVLITYSGAGQSLFVTKTFDTSVQTTSIPSPLMRRGILTANFVTNGGNIIFSYSTDPNASINAYTPLIPNQIFTLPVPSSQIKFAAVLQSATTVPCFIDEFAVQMDLGLSNNSPADVYFMPPMAAFTYQKYYDANNNPVQYGYQFINKSVGIVSSYNWSFGTSIIGISSYIPADSPTDPIEHRANPIVIFNNPGPFTIGLMVTGFVQNINGANAAFNSEQFSQVLNAT